MVKERSLWQWLAKARGEVPGLHLCRVENVAGRGMPDVNGWHPVHGEFWMELKVGSDRLSSAQVAWHGQRARAGAANVYILRKRVDGVRVITGAHGTRELASRADVWRFMGNPRGIDFTGLCKGLPVVPLRPFKGGIAV